MLIYLKANLANQKTDQLTEKKSIFEKSKEDILNAQDESDGMFPEENEEELLSNKNNNDFSNIREVVEAKEAKTPSTVNKTQQDSNSNPTQASESGTPSKIAH